MNGSFKDFRIAKLLFAALFAAVLTAGPQAVSTVGATGTRVDDMPSEMRNAYILGIQEELLKHGYHVGPIDGKVGKKTKGAIRQYQRDADLAVDGVPTKELLDHLKFAMPKVYARGTATEATPMVTEIQVELQKRGYYQGSIDGRVGPLTRGAVASFQRDAGLSVTGNVGSGVLSDLRAADSSIRRN